MTATLEHWRSAHAAFGGNGAGGAPAWVRELREAGMARFASLGFPSLKQEEWRFTNVAPVAATPFTLPHAPRSGAPSAREIRGLEVCEAGRHLLVFVNGRYSGALSSVMGLPKGATAGSLAQAMRTHPDLVRAHLGRYATGEGRAFASLNAAFLQDGGFVHVPAGVHMSEPVQFLYLTVPGAEPIVSHPRSLVVADRGARCAVVESYACHGDGTYLTNAVTELVAGDGARVDCYRIQRESLSAYHVGTTATWQGRDSTVNVHPVSFGAALARHDIDVVLDVRRNLAGDWSLKTEAAYEKVDANKVKFVLPLKAREKRQFSYDVTTNLGSNAIR